MKKTRSVPFLFLLAISASCGDSSPRGGGPAGGGSATAGARPAGSGGSSNGGQAGRAAAGSDGTAQAGRAGTGSGGASGSAGKTGGSGGVAGSVGKGGAQGGGAGRGGQTGGAGGISNAAGADGGLPPAPAAGRPRVDGHTVVTAEGQRMRGLQVWIPEEEESVAWYADQMSQRGLTVAQIVAGTENPAESVEAATKLFGQKGVYVGLAYYNRNPGQLQFYKDTIDRWKKLPNIFFILQPDGGYSPVDPGENEATYKFIRDAIPDAVIVCPEFAPPPDMAYVDFTRSAILSTENPDKAIETSAKAPALENKIGELDWATGLKLEKAGVGWVMQNHWSFGKPGSSTNDGATHNPGPTTTGTDKDWKDFDSWYAQNVRGTAWDWRK